MYVPWAAETVSLLPALAIEAMAEPSVALTMTDCPAAPVTMMQPFPVVTFSMEAAAPAMAEGTTSTVLDIIDSPLSYTTVTLYLQPLSLLSVYDVAAAVVLPIFSPLRKML